MKTLLLMRHAKSSWKHPENPDHERPLNKRGKKDAPLMGNLIKDKELIPQYILSSTACRAVETAEMVVKSSGFNGKVDYLDSFYMAEPNVYLDGLQTLPDEIERVMIIGHNPGLEGLLQILSGRVESLPTSSIAHIVLPINQWKDLNLDTEGELVENISPEDLKAKEKEKSKEKAKVKGKEKSKEKEKGKKK
jgi:phosphohistidine phosphatase